MAGGRACSKISVLAVLFCVLCVDVRGCFLGSGALVPYDVPNPNLNLVLCVCACSADTHLNMCTVLSDLKRHDKARDHCKRALTHIKRELFGSPNLPDFLGLPPFFLKL